MPELKKFSVLDNVGKVRYTVSFHDGVKTHGDGSPFYDIRLFRNKRKRDGFVKSLLAQGFVPG
jgi:hypothetical protein